jgi:glycosyltransferase involved in cell wall biosynthesis
LDGHVTFTGALEHEELLEVVSGAMVVVVPSRFEGFGLVALEAMALGRAVIASDAGGLPEVVGDTAIIVPAASPRLLAKAIADLISDPEYRAQLGTRAVERAKSFDLIQIAEQQIAAYESLLLSSERTKRMRG